MSDMEDLAGDAGAPAAGTVIEAELDKQKGIAATLIVSSGSLTKGSFIAPETAYAPVRILENYLGKQEESIGAGRPARILGWSDLPLVGSPFSLFPSKKAAEEHTERRPLEKEDGRTKSREQDAAEISCHRSRRAGSPYPSCAQSSAARPRMKRLRPRLQAITIPLVIRADSSGSLDGIHRELSKIKVDYVDLKIISEGIGEINEKDAKVAVGDASSIILGFNVATDPQAKGVIERSGVAARSFKITLRIDRFRPFRRGRAKAKGIPR